jgi:hypothetical protein
MSYSESSLGHPQNDAQSACAKQGVLLEKALRVRQIAI